MAAQSAWRLVDRPPDLNARLVEEVPAPIDEAGYAWRLAEDGGVFMLRATRSGLPG
jgi:hypothetical protein